MKPSNPEPTKPVKDVSKVDIIILKDDYINY
jgi:hypothetical protein